MRCRTVEETLRSIAAIAATALVRRLSVDHDLAPT